MAEGCGCCDEERKTCTCKGNLRHCNPQCTDLESSLSHFKHRGRTSTNNRTNACDSSGGGNPRMRVALLWRNMLAVILLSMIPDNGFYDSNDGPIVVDGAIESSSTSHLNNAKLCGEKADVEDEIPFIFDDEDDKFTLERNYGNFHTKNDAGSLHKESSYEVWNIKSGEKEAKVINTDKDKPLSSKEVERYISQRGLEDDSQDTIMIATIDGTFYGISRTTGQTIWKRHGINLKTNDNSSSSESDGNNHVSKDGDDIRSHSIPVDPSLNEIESVHQNLNENESIARSNKSREAIFAPLTSTSTTTKESDTSGMSSTMAIPYVDGRVFIRLGSNGVSSHHDSSNEKDTKQFTTTVSNLVNQSPYLDSHGKVYVGSRQSSAIAFNSDTGDILRFISDKGGDDISSAGLSSFGDDIKKSNSKNSNEKQKNIVWIGRVDYSVSVSDIRTGDADVQFSTSELWSIEDMVKDQKIDLSDKKNSIYNTSLLLPGATIAATPGGKLALRDPKSNTILWIADETFDTPVAFALESRSGMALDVDVIPDRSMRSDLSKEWKDFMDGKSFDHNEHSEIALKTPTTGELFIMSLGRRRNHNGMYGLPQIPRLFAPIESLGNYPVAMEDDSKAISAVWRNQHCRPQSPFFLECLRGPHDGTRSDWLSDIDHSLTYLPLEIHERNRYEYGNENRGSGIFFKVLMSWIPPAVALAFVVLFEMGRRGRAFAEKSRGVNDEDVASISTPSLTRDVVNSVIRTNDNQQQGVIQLSEEVLGYGGHGTVVYKGELDGRQVAVKRMLKAYHASAEREISLLIESDGHPHVVRYFLKETRGDFVYLALELCDITMQDLIVALTKKRIEMFKSNEESLINLQNLPGIEEALKKTLLEVAQGIKHIHSLRIVHRDLKPQNILLAKNLKRIRFTDNNESVDIYSAFQAGQYVPKISDMGLGKQLTGQSSFGLSTLNNSVGNGDIASASTVAGPGPGTVGWQAPEVMNQRLAFESPYSATVNSNSDSAATEDSPVDSSFHGRTSRSVDIFSLGCIFYCSFLPGSHPFGEWYERESNIMKNRPSLKALEEVSVDASQLIKSMIDRRSSSRPTAAQVCNHPLFWSAAKRLSFLCDLSDRLEVDAPKDETSNRHSNCLDVLLIEQHAMTIVGTAWGTKLDQSFFSTVTKFRSYDQSSVRDLLRLIRNKSRHFDELPIGFKDRICGNQEGLLKYFESKFPCLLMHCYNVCRQYLTVDDILTKKYDIPSTVRQPKPVEKGITINNTSNQQFVKQTLVLKGNCNYDKQQDPSTFCYDDSQSSEVRKGVSHIEKDEALKIIEHNSGLKVELKGSSIDFCSSRSDVIVWEGSNAASMLGCRGWMRSEEEWMQKTDTKGGKSDVNLIRNTEDQIYRTRLCNHWDLSRGAFCPMRKKNKCVFAHGPVELRVKEGKRNRWGRLVDQNGNNSNPSHSGGEDTYGAARSIETARKVEGKWKSESRTLKKGKNRGKHTGGGRKRSHSKNN